MKKLEAKTAFITGGASGIGLAIGQCCREAGMNVMLADRDEEALDALGGEFGKVACDVTDHQSVRSAAEETLRMFGRIHLLVNNAGIWLSGGAGENSIEQWRRTIDVNLMGVVHGVETFLPQIRSHGEGGYILNTGSVGGHIAFAGSAAYCSTKHAVTGYTESLAHQLAPEGIVVSLLCPGFTRTRLADEDSNVAPAVARGMSPKAVASHALDRMQAGDLYIFTHPGTHDEVCKRWPLIEAAFEAARQSEVIMSDPDSSRIASRYAIEELHDGGGS